MGSMKAMSEVMRKFGDEKSSTLLDEYERITFEIQLNQAILARSLSEPGRRKSTSSTTQLLAPPPLLAARDTDGSSSSGTQKLQILNQPLARDTKQEEEQGQCRHRRRRGYGFQKVMKKLLKPILGKMKGDNNSIIETPPDIPKDPRFWNKFSRSLRI
ncbi:uncharacterized protein LOC132630767 [Lycium barbarum]|uniref:uncharacterized protein LOC132630767 n=1 Tax=Lycium barbarum TaxID=112863 RepID=UPI00293E34C9|nr:uncharacterized protein LOC132630767 [Lycium barbarum]